MFVPYGKCSIGISSTGIVDSLCLECDKDGSVIDKDGPSADLNAALTCPGHFSLRRLYP